jgi:hypothetical protein
MRSARDIGLLLSVSLNLQSCFPVPPYIGQLLLRWLGTYQHIGFLGLLAGFGAGFFVFGLAMSFL